MTVSYSVPVELTPVDVGIDTAVEEEVWEAARTGPEDVPWTPTTPTEPPELTVAAWTDPADAKAWAAACVAAMAVAVAAAAAELTVVLGHKSDLGYINVNSSS